MPAFSARVKSFLPSERDPESPRNRFVRAVRVVVGDERHDKAIKFPRHGFLSVSRYEGKSFTRRRRGEGRERRVAMKVSSLVN